MRAEWEQKKREVTPLPTSYISDNVTFTPLKILSGMSYTKISGCFVIRNRENNKCYVGQSTDVIKRLKQLFKGTVPTNMVFAEDYYSSQDKENLFEFMISPQNSKDKLDSVQRELIEEYNAFNSGYNGTSGKTPIAPTFDSSKTSI